jgi:hypothetical protein
LPYRSLPYIVNSQTGIHDGQELEFDRQVDKQRTAMHDSVFHGLFGGKARQGGLAGHAIPD